MAQQDDAERTEEPTPKRREDARKRGEVAQSRDVASVLVLLTALGGLGIFFAGDLARALAQVGRAAWGPGALRPESLGDFHAVFVQSLLVTGGALAPLLLTLLAVGVTASLGQVGPLFTGKALAFKGERIDPLKGMKRLFSVDRWVELAKAMLKLAVVGVAAALVLRPAVGPMLSLAATPLAGSLDPLRTIVLQVAGLALLGLAPLALVDLAWVRHRHEKKLRMTRREVRDELREREGNPQQKARMRQLQRDLSRQRMIAEVANADVVVTNPSHYAVALHYASGEMSAPRVLAMGRNHVARRIRETARRNGVPIFENPPLARLLYRTARVGHEVPANLYRAVAEVLAYVYRLDPRRASAWGTAP